jgi:hypothetical protein
VAVEDEAVPEKGQPGRHLLSVIAVLISVVVLTIFKTPEIDNVVAWLFIGATILLLGAWAAIAIHHEMLVVRARHDRHMRRQERERREAEQEASDKAEWEMEKARREFEAGNEAGA